MHPLLADTIHFIEENFPSTTHWIVPAEKFELLQKKAPKKADPVVIEHPPQIVKRPAPEKKEEVLSPVIEKENPKQAVASAPLVVEDLSKVIKDLFPTFSTQKEPPQEKEFFLDPSYKKALKAQVVLFSFREGKASDLFLQNMSRAINVYFDGATVVDMQKWEKGLQSFTSFFQETEASVFIASQALYQKPQLLPFLKENPISSERFLGKGKLLLLPAFEIYFHDPMQKKELWKTICTLLNTHARLQASS